MLRKTLVTAALLSLAAGTATYAAPCKDAKGKFIKCPAAAAKPAVTKDKTGRCHLASGPKKGQLTKC
jgi:hypothetical protein